MNRWVFLARLSDGFAPITSRIWGDGGLSMGVHSEYTYQDRLVICSRTRKEFVIEEHHDSCPTESPEMLWVKRWRNQGPF